MKFIVVPILLLALLAQTFSQALYYIDYVVNKASFEAQCINKAKKWLNCNGQCLLAKKIIESEKHQQEAPVMKLAAKAESLSSKSFFIAGNVAVTTTRPAFYPYYNIVLPLDRALSFFHPPDMIA